MMDYPSIDGGTSIGVSQYARVFAKRLVVWPLGWRPGILGRDLVDNGVPAGHGQRLLTVRYFHMLSGD